MDKKSELFLAFVLLAFVGTGAQAQDVYNFYFQKSPKKKEQPLPVVEEEASLEEPVEIMEVDDDVLLVPDNWKPAPQRYKKVYVKKSPEASVATKIEEPKKEVKTGRGWQAKLGVGSLNVDNFYNTPYGYNLSQKTYVLGVAYHMSRYFEVNAELHLPNGDAEGNYLYGNYNLEPQGAIGIGATPIHLNVFGGEFLAIGVDGGVAFGNQTASGENSNRVYLGPRLSMNFSEKFSLIYSYKANFNTGQDNADFDMSSFTLAYKW